MVEAGTVVRAVRNFRGISQATFSRKIGVSVPTLYRLERNNPELDVDTIARACRELGITFDWATRRAKVPADLPAEAIHAERPSVVSVRLPRQLVEDLKVFAAAEHKTLEQYLQGHVNARGKIVREPMPGSPPPAPPASADAHIPRIRGARSENHENSTKD